MAIQLQVTTPQGYTCEYHKIKDIKIDWHERIANFNLISYKDQQARQSGFGFIMSENFGFEPETFVFNVENNNIEEAYEWLKANKYQDAIDVI